MRTAIAGFVAAVILLSAKTTANAADTYQLNIPSQPLAKALQTFAQQSGLSLVHYSGVIGPRQAPGLEGTYTPDAALRKLLENTGLEYSYVNESTIEIRAAEHGQVLSGHRTSALVGEGANESVLRLAQVFSDSPATAAESSASTQASSASQSDASQVKLEEIVVTAQKRAERLIDTPQSVAVLSSATLAKLAALQFRDFANTVPGLAFTTQGAGYTQISLRGVTAGFDIGQTVGIYVDDVPFGSSGAFANSAQVTLDVGLFDIDRIEVLRGPQGTLYGSSTMGGLLKYVSKKPSTETFAIDTQTGIAGTQDGSLSYNGAAAVEMPLVQDKAALRVSGFYSHDGGYIDNVALGRKDINRSNVYGGRLDLLLTPTDALTVRLGAFLQNITRDGQGTSDFTLAGAAEQGDLEQTRYLAEPFDQRFRLVSGTVGYDLGPVSLTSISSYQSAESEMNTDISRQFVPILASVNLFYSAVGIPQRLSTHKFTQEVRLASSEGSGTFEWLFGGYYTHEDTDNIQDFLLRDPAGLPAPNNLYTYSAPSRYQEIAAFGNLTWHLTDRFDLSGGVRRAQNHQAFEQFGSGAFGVTTPEQRSTENVTTYLANARYRFTDQATGYVRYATGYRPGGPNFVSNDPKTGLPVGDPFFEADRLKSYEGGIKAETSDRRFGIDAAVYHIDWDNIQIVTISGGFSAIANAGAATVDGAELTLTARPTGGFTATGAFGYQDARLAENAPDLGGVRDERLPNVPRFTAALSADYQLENVTLQPTFGATFRRVSERHASFDGSASMPQYQLPAYTTVDLRAGFVWGPATWQLYVRNVGDERGQLSAYTSRGPAQPAILQPRTFGASVSTHF